MNNLYGKRTKDNNVKNPFSDTFLDPLCKLNLNETSEFVKSFPMSNDNNNTTSKRTFLEASVSAQSRRKLESPTTPTRPVFSFNSVVVGGNLSRKNFPSKWDDAEKWLMNSSNFKHCDNFKQQQMEKTRVIHERVSKAVPNFQAFDGISCSSDIVLKDKFTESIEPIFRNFRYSEPSKEGFLFTNQCDESMKNACTEMIHNKDIGTEMSPLRICTTSKCNTPFKSSSPARHNTPASSSGPLSLSPNHNNNTSCNAVDFIRLEECHFAKLKLGTTTYDSVTSHWSSREEEEEEVSKSLRHNADSDCRTTTFEEEEKIKCCLRYQREEAKIQAWVDLQSAKAEAQSKKLEVKIQKLRSNLEEKLMKRKEVVQRKAEELRATAREQHFEQSQKATEQAQKIIMNQHNTIVSAHNSCGCFPSNNNHH
ncbi:hypothetical protein TanjilG_21555 [Lupinus angustifolius]|uniref:Remorin C-terminal domain-containing protein n=2 Tax=Lupinus angustifolius TaxID=3871 RepID=A0A4P1QUN3_LUPAN|nr:PREDICTED: uncharacterized protein LOC109329485 isoform X2 [Lupinus angustifolius]OIV95165.1 hypothetical protein TanjilG_21555 [Lupinus angustifolius]